MSYTKNANDLLVFVIVFLSDNISTPSLLVHGYFKLL